MTTRDEARRLSYHLRDIKHNIRGQREKAQQDLNALAALSHPKEQDIAEAKAAVGRFAIINKIDPYFLNRDIGFLTAWLANSGESRLGSEVVRIVEATVKELQSLRGGNPREQ